MGYDAPGSWLSTLDLAFVDARFGAAEVNRLLEGPCMTAVPEPPRVDRAGRLVVFVTPKSDAPASREPVRVVLRLTGDGLEVACTCTRGRAYVCAHVAPILIDLAVSPDLRRALADGLPVEGAIAALDATRRDALVERTLDTRLAQWLPPRVFDDALELDVTVAPSTGLATQAPRPALFLRHRRPPSRLVLRPKDVLAARLRPQHRRLVELTTPSSTHRDALVATGAQASLLIELLKCQSPLFTRSFRGRIRFGTTPVRPHVERDGDRLVARWYDDERREPVCDVSEALLFVGPFPYMWSVANGIFHPVADDVDLDAAWGLQCVPTLPLTPSTELRIGAALSERERGLGIVVPRAETFGLTPLSAPTFSVRLSGSPLDVHAELFAHYGTRQMVVTKDPCADETDTRRHARAEGSARARLHEVGFSDDEAGELRAVEDEAVRLWRQGLRELSEGAPPIEVLVAESLTRGRPTTPIAATVDAKGDSGWLDVALTFTAGGVKVEMAAIRKALAANKRWLSLDDGTLTKITDAIATLIGEAETLFGYETPRARLGPWHLERVEGWCATHGGQLDDESARLRARLAAKGIGAEPRLPRELRATLRPYQREGLAWLSLLRDVRIGGLLADDMGLGKTLMVLTLLAQWKQDEGQKPSLVVCPTSLLASWQREAEKFTPSLNVCIVHNLPKRRRMQLRHDEHDLVVTSYGLMRTDAAHLKNTPFRALVLDEAQNIKNADARTTRAAGSLRAELRLALTGTPIENRAGELWSLANFANPGMLGPKRAFDERYEHALTLDGEGATARELRKAVHPFILRRTKAQVLPELPQKIEIDRVCVLGERQRRLYDALAYTLKQSVKKNIEKRGLQHSRVMVLTAILRLRQMACDPRLVDPTVEAVHSAKREAFLELVRELAASNRRSLVFSQFVELFTLWRQDLDREKIAYEYLDGASVRRGEIVDRFQKGSATLFLVTLKAGGAGLNLTAADTVIHCDPWWNPAAEDQATDRAHRIGQARNVTVVRLHAQGTIEEKIAMLKERKRTLAAALLDPAAKPAPEGDLTQLSTEDAVALLDAMDGSVARRD